MERVESQEAGFPPLTRSLDTPLGLPHSYDCWRISKCNSGERPEFKGLRPYSGHLDVFEAIVVALPVQIRWIRRSGPIDVLGWNRSFARNAEVVGGVSKGSRLQQDDINYAENGGGDPNAETESQNAGERNLEVLREAAGGIAESMKGRHATNPQREIRGRLRKIAQTSSSVDSAPFKKVCS
jgi:hypothetical protein